MTQQSCYAWLEEAKQLEKAYLANPSRLRRRPADALAHADSERDERRGPGDDHDGNPDALYSEPGGEQRQQEKRREAVTRKPHPHAIFGSTESLHEKDDAEEHRIGGQGDRGVDEIFAEMPEGRTTQTRIGTELIRAARQHQGDGQGRKKSQTEARDPESESGIEVTGSTCS